jgi:hypothetical protein
MNVGLNISWNTSKTPCRLGACQTLVLLSIVWVRRNSSTVFLRGVVPQSSCLFGSLLRYLRDRMAYDLACWTAGLQTQYVWQIAEGKYDPSLPCRSHIITRISNTPDRISISFNTTPSFCCGRVVSRLFDMDLTSVDSLAPSPSSSAYFPSVFALLLSARLHSGTLQHLQAKRAVAIGISRRRIGRTRR